MTFFEHFKKITLFFSILPVMCCSPTTQEEVRTGTDDNSRKIESRVDRLAMVSPHEAIAIIDSAEKEGAVSPFWARKRQAMIYFNPIQDDHKVIECVKDALGNNERTVSTQDRIQLLRLMSNSYYFLGEYGASIDRAMEGERLAESIDSLAAQGEFKFIMGECMIKLGQTTPGYADMEYGIAALSRAKDYNSRSTLSHLLGEEMTFMIADDRIDDAITTGMERERILEELKAYPSDDPFLDQQFGYLYGKMAYLYARSGDMEKASDYAVRFYDTEYSRDRIGRLRILEYLLESGQPLKALELLQGSDYSLEGDTVSADASYYLRLKARACSGIGDFRSAYSLLDRSYAIRDSLDSKMDNESAFKVFSMSKAHELEMQKQEAETKEARYLLSLILIITLCIIIASAFLYYYCSTKNIIEKNRLIAMGRSDTKEYVRLLQTAQAKIHELMPKEEENNKIAETDSWQLFLKLEDAMEKDRIYLNKNITRADILGILGIGKNRLAQMFQDVGGDLSLPTYINSKRLNHALEVIAEHPEYTVNEIAEASGFANTRNFHLLFKKRFGITPLQYRNGK